MRFFVFGVLLLQTLNAQSSLSGSGDEIVTAVDTPAPLLTPGAESDLLSSSTDAAATSEIDFDTLDLPTGTADVIVDSSTITSPSDNVLDDSFGGGETPGPGIEMGDLSGLDFPSSSPVLAPALTPVSEAAVSAAPAPKTAVDDPIRNGFVAPVSTSPDEFGLGTPATESVDVETSATPSAIVDSLEIATDDFDDFATASDDVPEPTDAATDPLVFSDVTDTASVRSGFGGAAAPDAATDDDSTLAPEIADLPESEDLPLEDEGGADARDATDDDFALAPEITGLPESDDVPLLDEELGSSPTPDLGPTSSIDDLLIPSPDNNTDVDGSVSAALGAVNDGEESPSAWTGEGTTEYDGQDYGEDDECPSYCLESGCGDDSGDYDDGDDAGDSEGEGEGEVYDDGDSEDDDEGDDDEPYMWRVLDRFRRRHNVPSSNGGFSALPWPGHGKKPDGDECNDVPDWLYESRGRRPKPCKPKCPASCYATSPSCAPRSPTPKPSSAKPSDSWSRSRRPWNHARPTSEPYAASSISDDYYGPSTTPNESSPDSAVSTASDGNDAYVSPDSYDSTTTATQTTFVTSVITAESWHESSTPDYTGDTLDSVCPKTCNPMDPAANTCDITSSCTTTGNGKYYCACRAGFRADAWNAKDFSKQFKLDSQPYVYTAEGVVCDKVCDDQTCSEVLSRPQCQ
jgi:hypothetical protein